MNDPINNRDKTERQHLTQMELRGFKSIDDDGQSLSFGDINLFIGPNGSGKSNVLAFFSLLNYLSTGAMNKFIFEDGGGASAFLHDGPKVTRCIEANITFENDEHRNTYAFTLSHAAGDRLLFTEEHLLWQRADKEKPFAHTFEPGGFEASLIEAAQHGEAGIIQKTASRFRQLLRGCQVFHFHDTSPQARIHRQTNLHDNRFLRSDAGNLAAFLYRLREDYPNYYRRILSQVKRILPQFGDFILEPIGQNPNILLQWEDHKRDYLLGSQQLSDGSLRFMALATLLLQPPDLLPQVIVLDEPELGLHLDAMLQLIGMVRTASAYSQIILASHDTQLLNALDASQIVVSTFDPQRKSSVFNRLPEEALAEWLENYTMAELWEKNILGGKP